MHPIPEVRNLCDRADEVAKLLMANSQLLNYAGYGEMLRKAVEQVYMATPPLGIFLLKWERYNPYHLDAILGDKDAGDYVQFGLTFQATCHRRGPYKLLIEVCSGEHHHKWGCFDEQDQPVRYYHNQFHALEEADMIAKILKAEKKES